MYATCLFCNSALGANESIEQFPVGRRLAYDAAKGRLWVVCRKCERWNLSPIETRWEAIEEIERAFRNTKVRVSTDNIGLAKLRDGLELVRVGKPPDIELATWRYGDQMRHRHRKFLVQGAVVAAAFAIPFTAFGYFSQTMLALPFVLGGAIVPPGAIVQGIATKRFNRWRYRELPIAIVRDHDDQPLRLTQDNINGARLIESSDTGWTVSLPHTSVKPADRLVRALGGRQQADIAQTPALLHGDTAIQALTTLMPNTNRFGANDGSVRNAVQAIQQSANLNALLTRAAQDSKYRPNPLARAIRNNLIAYAPEHVRLALEMTLHSADEERAMRGELRELEQRWKEADAIAKIADEMFLPEKIESQVRQWNVEP